METSTTQKKVNKPKKTSANVVAASSSGIWTECSTYPGVYASEEGKILLSSGVISKARANREGYVNIKVYDKQVGRSVLVADAYLPPDPTRPEVDHINRIRSDDKLCNLRRCTRVENANNRTVPKRYRSKSVAQYEDEELIRIWPSAWDAAEGLNSNNSNTNRIRKIHKAIQICCNGRQKDAKGFVWKWYVEKIPNEEWKTLEVKTKNKGKIQILVSNKARVDYENEIRTGSLRSSGYVELHIGNTTFKMHTLVCRAFHGERSHSKMTPDHINRNASNNDASNLRWATRGQQNENRGVINNCGQTSAIISVDKNGKEVYYINMAVASRDINIPRSTIHDSIKYGRTNKKTGLRFRHATPEEIETYN